jgi:hypothetical protein
MNHKLLSLPAVVFLLLSVWGICAWTRSYQPGASATPSTFKLQTVALRSVLPTVSFNGVGLSDVVDFLRDVSGQRILLNRPALSAAGIDAQAPITSGYSGIPLGDALARILPQAGNLGFESDGTTIIIAPKDQAGRVIGIERPSAILGHAHTVLRNARVNLRSTDYSDLDLGNAIELIASQTGASVSCDWRELEAAGIDPETRVDVPAPGPAAAVFQVLLANLRATRELQFVVGASGIRISTRQAFDREPAPSWVSFRLILVALSAPALLAGAAWVIRRRLHRAPSRRALRCAGLGLLALLLLTTMTATWAHGPPWWEFVPGSNRWTITADHGTLRLWHTPTDPSIPYQDLAHLGTAKAPDQDTLFDTAGLSIRRGDSPFNSWVAGMPLWEFVPVMVLLPVVWMILLIRRWREIRPGCCPRCGYDLRASNERCPECGMPMLGGAPSL